MFRIIDKLPILMILLLCATGCNFLESGEDTDTRADGDMPAVVSSNPEDGDHQISRTPEIEVNFNVPMDRTSVEAATGFIFDWFAVPFDAVWEDSLTYLIIPTEMLAFNTAYSVYIGTGAMSMAGDPLDARWTINFVTATREPAVVETWPATAEIDVPINANPWLRFNQAMDAASVAAALTVSPAVEYSCQWSDVDRLTLAITGDLTPLTEYTVTLGTGAANHNVEYTLTAPYGFTFTTAAGSDSELPHITAWDPPNGSQGVPVDIGAVTVSFSEPINPLTLLPEIFDMRMLVCVEEFVPIWNEDFTELTITFADLPAGVELFIDLAAFEDQVGNRSADPESWRIVTAGDEDWFPNGAHDQWYGVRTGEGDRCHPWEYTFVNRVNDVYGNEFNITEYVTECDEDVPVRGLRFNKLAGRVEVVGLGKYAWDDNSSSWVWAALMLEPRPDWLQLPLEAGSSWSGTCSLEMDMEPGLGTLTYSAALIGHEDLELTYSPGEGTCLPRTEEPDSMSLSAVLPDCAVVEMNHEVTINIPIADGWETVTVHSGIDTVWYSPGVGMVQLHTHASDTDAEGCTRTSWSREKIYWWSINR
ncbi:MAG: Ig-like domain-containing protein [bacterium]|nr:Ig-like domain-containing protein [bacterium]